MALWEIGPGPLSALVEAWRQSRLFLAQTLTAFAQHPSVVLLYAAPPATARAWLLLRTKPVPGWWLPSLEALIAVWRLLMCVVALWVVLTPGQMDNLQHIFTSNALIQNLLDAIGENFGQQLWLLFWEIVICLAAFFLLNWLLGRMARLWVQGLDIDLEHKLHQRRALVAVARNLLMVPLVMIYAVVVIRQFIA